MSPKGAPEAARGNELKPTMPDFNSDTDRRARSGLVVKAFAANRFPAPVSPQAVLINFNFRGSELCIWPLSMRVGLLGENQGQHLKWPAIQRDIPIPWKKLLAICLKDSAAIDRLVLVSK